VHPGDGDNHEAFAAAGRGRFAGRDFAPFHIEQSCPGTGPVHPTWQFCRWCGRARDEQRPVDGRRRPMPAYWKLARRSSPLGRRLWRAWLGDNGFRFCAGLLNRRGLPRPAKPAVRSAASAPGYAFTKTQVVTRSCRRVGRIGPTGPLKARPDDRPRPNPPRPLIESRLQRRITHSPTRLRGPATFSRSA
jgi:hypothetical protein